MGNIVNKVLGIILVLALMLLMLCNVMVADQLQARRSIVAEVTNFIDEVTDSGTLTEKQVADLYLACNAYGPVCDVKIQRLTRRVNPTGKKVDGKYETYTTYSVTDNIYTLNQGDLIRVSVDEVGYTSLSYFIYMTTHLVMRPVDFDLTGRVRT